MKSAFLTLTVHDLAVSFKNKTFYLLIFIAVLISGIFHVIDRSIPTFSPFRVGLMRDHDYPAPLLRGLTSADKMFEIEWHNTTEAAYEAISKKRIDGLLTPSENPRSVDAMIYSRESMRGAALIESLGALQLTAEGQVPWVANVKRLGQGGLEEESLPTWVLMMLLMVGFVVLPTQVAEEKEKRLLLGLLLTPMSEVAWIMAKLTAGTILGLGAVLLLHLLSQVGCLHWFVYLGFLCAGAFYFSGLGVLLGILCRTQASARALGMVFYLIHLLPSALGDFSDEMTIIARVMPSSQFYVPVKSLLQGSDTVSLFSWQVVYLCAAGMSFSIGAFYLLKKRWQMAN